MDYIPEAGDIVWLDFDPQSGHEQAGRRPAPGGFPPPHKRRQAIALRWLFPPPLTMDAPV